MVGHCKQQLIYVFDDCLTLSNLGGGLYDPSL